MRRALLFASLLPLAVTSSAGAQARDITVNAMRTEQRVALVIGNGAYPTSPLRNPVGDARAMAQALRDLGFEVIERTNVGYKDVREYLRDEQRSQPGCSAGRMPTDL